MDGHLSVLPSLSWDFGIGSEDAMRLSCQRPAGHPLCLIRTGHRSPDPSCPSSTWSRPSPTGTTQIGDILQSFFFSPKDPVGGWIVGAGPVFLYPSASDDALGAELLKLGSQPVEFTLGARYYAEKPEGGPDWGLRFVVTLLFPK